MLVNVACHGECADLIIDAYFALMCLGVPGKVVALLPEDDVLMGKVDFDGIRRRVCLACVPDVQVGDYVLVHVGFALSRIDAHEAARVLRMLDELRLLHEELGADGSDA